MMLIEFSVENFRSFKERQTLSLVASSDKAHEGNLIPREKENLLKAVAVLGANASGKSNLVAAIRATDTFIGMSATRMTQGDKIAAADPFCLDTDSSGEPSTFEMVLIVDDVRYVYGFSVTSERVHGEWLDAYPEDRAKRWFERNSDDPTSWKFGKLFSKEDTAVLRKMTRPNGLILSRGAELNIEPLSKLYLWFRERHMYLGAVVPSWFLRQKTLKRMKDDEAYHARVTRLLHDADVGISDIKLAEKPVQLEAIPSAMRELLSDDLMKKLAENGLVDIRSLHKVAGGDVPVEFDFEQAESDGTKRLFALAGPILDALDTGALVVADELDSSMHPHLTRKLIELFQNPKVNRKGAQLIFTTHDTTLMDHTLFRRDQIWFTEKNAHGATELFSLYDFKTEDGKPRVNEAFERRYLAGRYGAVPQFGPALEDADLE
jgi:hypothetical protein